MCHVEIDKSQNLIKFKFESVFNEEEAKQCFKETENCLSQLKLGFQILTDLSTIEDIDDLAISFIDQIMDICNQKACLRL